MVTGSRVRRADDGDAMPPPPSEEGSHPPGVPPPDAPAPPGLEPPRQQPALEDAGADVPPLPDGGVEPALPPPGEDGGVDVPSIPPLPAVAPSGPRRSARGRARAEDEEGGSPPQPSAASASADDGAPPPPGHHALQDSYDQKWDAKYDELVAYHAANGDANVPQSRGLLGRWVGRQREFKKKNTLSSDRVERLEKLGIHWAPKKDLPSWDERYRELVEYKAEHNSTNVPTSGLGLGSWVRVQRACMKKGKLPQDKIDRLNAIDFNFKPGVTPKTFDERFAEVEEYKRRFGDANVPTSYTTLGRWVAGIRMKKARLRKEQVERFDAIGFLWKPGRGKVNNRNIGRGKRRKPTTEVINVNTIVSDDVKARAAESDVSLRVLAATSLLLQPGEEDAPGADDDGDDDGDGGAEAEDGAQGMEGVEMADEGEMLAPPRAPPGAAGMKTEGMEEEEGVGEEDAAAGLEEEAEVIAFQAI